MAETTCYLHIEPRWADWTLDENGDPTLHTIVATKLTQSRPKKFAGTVVKLRLRIPDGAFKPLRPTVTIDIPEAALDFEPEVTVELPDEPEDGT